VESGAAGPEYDPTVPDEAGDGAVVEWLLEGDPAIRWQAMRDLLEEPASIWEAERERVLETGWVADLLRRQGGRRRVANGSMDGLDVDAAPARGMRTARGPSRRA